MQLHLLYQELSLDQQSLFAEIMNFYNILCIDHLHHLTELLFQDVQVQLQLFLLKFFAQLKALFHQKFFVPYHQKILFHCLRKNYEMH